MIKIEKIETYGWEASIRGMRNPMNSWSLSDSRWQDGKFIVGPNDYGLMLKLSQAGDTHSKYLRMIGASMDITAPLYWWKEFDTYKVGTVANSCSTMHKITSKPIELSDFSYDDFCIEDEGIDLRDCFINVVTDCEMLRRKFLETKEKKYWRGLIQLLPSSYNQKRTVTLNYQVLKNLYETRKNHKLQEWRDFCNEVEGLPCSDLITGRWLR